MRPLATFLALPGGDRLLLLRAAATLVVVRCALHLLSIERLRRWAGHLRDANRPADPIIWSVRTAARSFPGIACLDSAQALQSRPSPASHPLQLIRCVARDASGFTAHAWLVHDGIVVIGEEEHERYARLTAWDASKTLGMSG